MNRTYKILFYCFVFLFFNSCGTKDLKNETLNPTLGANNLILEKFDNGVLSIHKPNSWSLQTIGECENFAFAVFDTSKPDCRVFFINKIGPVYQSIDQKRMDLQYIKTLGAEIDYIEMPVIIPFTPKSFFENITAILQTGYSGKLSEICPRFDKAIVITSENTEALLTGGKTEIITAVYKSGANTVQTMLIINLAPDVEQLGKSKPGLGHAYLITGFTAPVNEFNKYFPDFIRIAESYHLNETGYRNCVKTLDAFTAEILKSGKSLSVFASLLMNEWNNRDVKTDMKVQINSDLLLGYKRLFDAEKKQIYLVTSEFADNYLTNKSTYKSQNLKILAEDKPELWLLPVSDSTKIQ